MSVTDKKEPLVQKEEERKEAGVKPDMTGSIQYQKKIGKAKPKNPYEQVINGRIENPDANKGKIKISFEAKEFFNQADFLSQQIPYWTKDKDNPIYQYIPTSEQPFQTTTTNLYDPEHDAKERAATLRQSRL